MSGRSYMIATRMPMSRAGFDGWLAAPLPGLDAIANPSAMWAGWAYDGETPDWDLHGVAGSPAAVAGIREHRASTPARLLAARAANGFTLARHRDGTLELYLYDYHQNNYQTQTDLLMLAGAGRFAAAETPVLHWGGNVYPDLPLGGDPPIAVLLAGPAGARFVAVHPVAALIESLRPVEAAFLAGADEEGNWDATGMLDPAVQTV